MKRFGLDTLKAGHDGCPSDLALDRLAAREAEAERGTLEAHVASCAECSARLGVRMRGWAATPIDPRPVLATVRSRVDARTSWWRWLLAAGAPIALAVTLIVAGGLFRDGTRAKGEGPAFALTVFRYEDGGAQKVPSGTIFAAGDRLRFVVDVPTAGSVSIIGLDSTRRLYTAWPREGADPYRAAGNHIELPGAVALDDSTGDETLFAVHCPGRRTTPVCSPGSSGSPTCEGSCTLLPYEVKRQ